VKNFFFLEIQTSTQVGAFIYPHGALSTFELAYGPKGWYLKHPFRLLNKTITNFIRTTTTRPPLSDVKWNFTWRYNRPQRTKLFTTTSTISSTKTTTGK
jgi:hypothetical protein